MSYEAFVLLPNSNFTLEQAVKLLEARFVSFPNLKLVPQKRVLVQSDTGSRTKLVALERVLLKADDRWQLKVHLNLEPHVIEESAELAQSLEAGTCTAAAPELLERAKNAKLETFPARLEISSSRDPNMDHFNDYLFVLEALQALEGSVAFDPSTNMFV